jgi:metal-sulfur cluster biosynthetic enzyme
MMTEQQVVDVLRGVTDPELGLNIVDLGLVEQVAVDGDAVAVSLIMTSPACPQGEYLADEATRALAAVAEAGRAIRVSLLAAPHWSPDRISEQGRRSLGWDR